MWNKEAVTYFALIHCNCDQHVAFPACLVLFLQSFLKQGGQWRLVSHVYMKETKVQIA